VDEAAALGKLEELRRLRGIHRERLLADDVLTCLERRLDLRVVQMVRRRQVDDVDAPLREHRLEALERLGERNRAALRANALGARPDDADDVDPEPAKGVDVNDADEPRPDDRRSQLSHVRHRWPILRAHAPPRPRPAQP
jgi:hypothetical protein